MTAGEAAPPATSVRRWRYGSAVQVARALNAVAREPRHEGRPASGPKLVEPSPPRSSGAPRRREA